MMGFDVEKLALSLPRSRFKISANSWAIEDQLGVNWMKAEKSILRWLLGNRSGRVTVQEPGE